MPPRPDGEKRQPPQPVLLRPNALEIPLPIRDFMLEYEREAFGWFAEQNPELFGLGPNMTEFVLGKCGLGGYTKPDGLFFETQDAWRLRKVLEIRSGDVYGVSAKIRGFAKTLDCFRPEPDSLVQALRKTAGNVIRVPEGIIIPDDAQIEVVFVSHRDQLPKNMPPSSGFKVSYLQY